jgi:hypothetical protein
MNWVEVAVKLVAENSNGVKLAPLRNISGVDIRFDKGYGTLKINVPADVAKDLTNGSGKYVGGLLLIDRQTYEAMKGGAEE